jgi:hypothetical protein
MAVKIAIFYAVSSRGAVIFYFFTVMAVFGGSR